MSYVFVNAGLSDTKSLFNVLIEALPFDETFTTNPKNEGTAAVFCHFIESIDADAGVGGCFFKGQVLLFPNGDFLHRLLLLKSISQLVVVAADVDPFTIIVAIAYNQCVAGGDEYWAEIFWIVTFLLFEHFFDSLDMLVNFFIGQLCTMAKVVEIIRKFLHKLGQGDPRL